MGALIVKVQEVRGHYRGQALKAKQYETQIDDRTSAPFVKSWRHRVTIGWSYLFAVSAEYPIYIELRNVIPVKHLIAISMRCNQDSVDALGQFVWRDTHSSHSPTASPRDVACHG